MTKGPEQRKALGKGLSALLPGGTTRAPNLSNSRPRPEQPHARSPSSSFRSIQYEPNPVQPRRSLLVNVSTN